MRKRSTNPSSGLRAPSSWGGPEGPAAQGTFKVADSGAGHGIDHLLVKLGVALRGRQAVLRQQARVIQVHRGIEGLTGRIVVHHFQVVVHGPQPQIVLPGDIDYHLIYLISLELAAEDRVKSEGPQAPARRGLYPDAVFRGS
jgi:hypothetical protein